MTSAAQTDAAMTEVYIDDSDRYRIYQVASGNRLWLSNPAPVIKKNGSVLTAETGNFTIDYVGGAIIFDSISRLESTDTVTASFTSVTAGSARLNTIENDLDTAEETIAHYKGYHTTYAALVLAFPSAANGDFAIVAETDNVYVWVDSEWKPVYVAPDFTNYYTKTEVDNALSEKQATIVAQGDSSASDDYYYGGRKTWQNLLDKVRSTVLTGLSTATSAAVAATDTILVAIGKLQAQITGKPFLTGSGDPTTATAGSVGQRYVNTSSGAVFRLKSVSGSTYTWVQQGSTLDLVDLAVTNAKLANMPSKTLKGNNQNAAAAADDLTVQEVLTILNVSDGADKTTTAVEGASAIDSLQDADGFAFSDNSQTAGSRLRRVTWSTIKTLLQDQFSGLTHASRHASDGDDPVSPNSIGAAEQVSTMPTAAASYVGRIIQYIGETGDTYKQGTFYLCVLSSGTYSWQAVSGGGGGSVSCQEATLAVSGWSQGTIGADYKFWYEYDLTVSDFDSSTQTIMLFAADGAAQTFIESHVYYEADVSGTTITIKASAIPSAAINVIYMIIERS